MKLTTTDGKQIEINPLYVSMVKWNWLGGATVYCNGFMGNRVFKVKESARRVRELNREAVRKIAPTNFDLVKRELCDI